MARRLGRLKRCLAPFEREPVHFLRIDAERLAYARLTEQGDPMVMVLNRAPASSSMNIDLNETDLQPSRRMIDVLTGHAYDVQNGTIRDVSTRPGQVLALIDSEHPCYQEEKNP